MAAGEFRLRVCHAKSGRARFLSHLEVMRALERSSRRAALPYAVTKGFNPHMKAAFGPALPVGTAGEREYFDIWLTQPVPAAEALERLRRSTPGELGIREVRYVHEREPSLTAASTMARYEVAVGGEGVTAEGIAEALVTVIGEGRLEVERKGKTKVFDLARSLPEEVRVGSTGPPVIVEVTTRMGQEGSLRPDALLEEALSRAAVDGAVVSVTRTDILIEEEGVVRRPL
ncbi:MAG: TIGR03936 family radical SAM-associated protein [Anaerosomatales bacterium]|nr:TIGR03936 family radical SAM-associated protein [Anaerosomatales bacterium]MDT8433550.1 TIGR03936 family radical SAM-associated protein [Anaerosomatales bacterium]